MEPSHDFTDHCWYKPDGQSQTVKMRRQHSSPPSLSATSYKDSDKSTQTFSPTTTLASSVSEGQGNRRRVRIQMPTSIMPVSSANIEALETKTSKEAKGRLRHVPPPPPPSRTHSSQSSNSMAKYGFVPVSSSDFSAFTDITTSFAEYENTQFYDSMEEIDLLPKLPSAAATYKDRVSQPIRGGFKSKKSKPKARAKSSSTYSRGGFLGYGYGKSGSVGERGQDAEEDGRAVLYVDEPDQDRSWYRPPQHPGVSSSSAPRGAKFLKASRRDVGTEGRVTLKRWYFALLKKLFNF